MRIEYTPAVDTREVTDEALELWYGVTKREIELLRDLEGCHLQWDTESFIDFKKNGVTIYYYNISFKIYMGGITQSIMKQIYPMENIPPYKS